MSYNLLDEQWIPVLWKCGKPGKVGIRKALEKALVAFAQVRP